MSIRLASGIRWMKFNAVGGLGIGVQLAVLSVAAGILHLHYLAATAIAVEVAVVHNYLWHQRFTWMDRPASRGFVRFIKFNLTTGALSIVGNLVFMRVLVGVGRLNYLAANLVTIAVCSIANFLLSDRVVFQEE